MLLAELRPRQWLKNGALLLPLVYSLRLIDPEALGRALLAFASFCCLSSAGYVFNDLRDLEADRVHPAKQHRPLAAGTLSVGVGVGTMVLLGLLAIVLGAQVGPPFLGTCALYLAISASYSLWWKHIVLIDLFGISAGFVTRIVGGAVAVNVGVSPWLYACAILGSLLIALGKRRAEVLDLRNLATVHRPALESYTVEFLDQLMIVVSAASIMAYSLYTFLGEFLPRNNVMMTTIPIVLYGMFRYLYLTKVRGLGGSPEELLLGDRALASAVALFVLLSGGILYLNLLRP